MPTNYVSRDYASIKADLVGRARATIPEWYSSTSPDFAMLLIDLWSYMGDIQNYYIDRAHTEAYLDTATQTASVRALARMMGYQPNARTSASATVTVANSSSAAIIIDKGTEFLVPVTSSKAEVTFTSSAVATAPANGSVDVPVDEGKVVTETLTSNFSGESGAAFLLAEQNIVPASLSITVGTLTYSHTTRMFDVGSDSPAFMSLVDSEDFTRVVLGNGVNGRVPQAGSVITVTYRRGQGALGNVDANAITAMAGAPIRLTVTKSTVASGGTDAESVPSIKKNAPALRRVQDRAVTLTDYVTIMKGFAGVTKAVALSSVSSGLVTVKYAALPTFAGYNNMAAATTTLYLSPNSQVTTGTAQAGSTTTITLASGESATDDFFNDMVVTITSGTGADQTATITDYVGSTKVATAPFTTAPASDSVYKITNGSPNFGTHGSDIDANMTSYLQNRSMIGVTVAPISTTITLTDVHVAFNSVQVEDGYYQEAVKTSIDTAVRSLFFWDALDFNTTIRLSEILYAAQSVPGVKSVFISNLGSSSSGTSVADHDPTLTTTSAVYFPVLRSITFAGVSGGIS